MPRALAPALPGVSGVVSGAVDEELAGIRKELLGDGDPTAIDQIPPSGMSSESILAMAKVPGHCQRQRHPRRRCALCSIVTGLGLSICLARCSLRTRAGTRSTRGG